MGEGLVVRWEGESLVAHKMAEVVQLKSPAFVS